MPAIDYSNLKPPSRATLLHAAKDDGSSASTATTTPGAYIPLALLSGFFAALASVFAKLFTDTRTEAVAQWICHASNAHVGLDLCAENHRDLDAGPNIVRYFP
ncbi:hypothetical protein BC937DRAFT_94531 [Endogone sp. FLAS-F59071]|nr:hypothetical protein BC937DRAFT_94531 [Endogone sp. FLAS-F59071]|eukprot:RUS20724.1 hypothetical protein BC937DRAFT_94531 [Endogone sp. FLAS-F59071]